MDEKKWFWQDIADGVLYATDGFLVSFVCTRSACLISGDVKKALTVLDLNIPVIGMAGIADGSFALRVARNTVFVLSDRRLDACPGWYPEGFALSRVDRQWQQLSLEGERVEDVLRQGTTVDFESPSGATLLFGRTCYLTRSRKGFRLFVDAPYLQYYHACLTLCND